MSWISSVGRFSGDPHWPVLGDHRGKETYFGHVDPVGLRSCYDEGKRYAEALTMAYNRNRKVRTGIARIFNTYGPRMADDGRVVPTFIRQILKGNDLTVHGNGRQTRSFCFVDDLIEGLIRLAKSDDVGPINLGGTEEITVIELARLVRDIARSPNQEIVFVKGNDGDPQRRRPDISKARKMLKDWHAEISLTDGLARTISYFRSQVD